MKWLLVAVILGQFPVETGSIYESLVDCYKAQQAIKNETTNAILVWRNTEGDAYSPGPGQNAAYAAARRSLGAENGLTCIPHRG